jgi:hypothetical protein
LKVAGRKQKAVCEADFFGPHLPGDFGFVEVKVVFGRLGAFAL